MALETAEEFEGKLLACQQREGWHQIIEARDNAVRLALLEEMLAIDEGSASIVSIRRAATQLKAKYSVPIAEPPAGEKM